MTHSPSHVFGTNALRSTTRSRGACAVISLAIACVLMLAAASASAQGISGTLSNFDVFNDTPTDAYGAELELEGVHSIDVSNTYPSHYDNKTLEDYSDGVKFGTRVRFSGYNFNANGFLAPTVGQSTNGHFCVDLLGCEHFGFDALSQPTATRFYWLDQNLQRIGSTPASIPSPIWTYVPPVNVGNPPVVRAAVEVPEPAEVEPLLPDSLWMKVFVTELERPVSLAELISNGGVAPEDEAETETEWELLEGGVMQEVEAEVGENAQSILRRYEFFEYTGLYSDEHEPLSTWNGSGDPPAAEFGHFIAANMVAANLVPEPSSMALALGGVAVLGLLAYRRRRV